mgnify:CR=1 FL=1
MFANDNLSGVLEQVEWLSARGYVFSEEAQEQLGALYEGDQAVRLGSAFATAAPAVTTSSPAGGVPEEIRLPEASLWDAAEGRMFTTTIVSRGLFVIELDGDWREVPIDGAGSLAGIVLDAPRDLIWVGSGVVDQTPEPETAFRGVIALDRTTLEERRRVPAPEGVTISDIAVGPDGTIYGSDPIGGAIYSATTADTVMQPFIAPGTFRSPQGIAVRDDNSAFYVSDYRYGLAQVMISSRAVYRMGAVEPMLLDGVDGLWLHGNQLIAVQNGLNPHRITAFELDARVGVIASHRILERANPEWTEPLGGVISGDTLYYIGTGQWDLYGEAGGLREGMSARPSQIRTLQLVETASQLP